MSDRYSNHVLNNFSDDVIKKKEGKLLTEVRLKKNRAVAKQELDMVTEEKVLSVVMPAYNASKWILNALSSLSLCNCFNSLDVVVINDGSTDNTLELVTNFIKDNSYENSIRIVNKQNGGHGSAINKGISESKGKYLKVLDADDYFDVQELDRLAEKIKNSNSDIILTNYIEDNRNLNDFVLMEPYLHLKPGTKYAIEDLVYPGYGFDKHLGLIHTSTYKTDFLKELWKKVHLTEHCFYVDMELNAYTFIFAKTLEFYPLSPYIYLVGRAEQSVSKESFMKRHKQHERVIFEIIEKCNLLTKDAERKRCVKRTILDQMIGTQTIIYRDFLKDKKSLRQFKKLLRKSLESNQYS